MCADGGLSRCISLCLFPVVVSRPRPPADFTLSRPTAQLRVTSTALLASLHCVSKLCLNLLWPWSMQYFMAVINATTLLCFSIASRQKFQFDSCTKFWSCGDIKLTQCEVMIAWSLVMDLQHNEIYVETFFYDVNWEALSKKKKDFKDKFVRKRLLVNGIITPETLRLYSTVLSFYNIPLVLNTAGRASHLQVLLFPMF
jgi:hypothetical protein